ncbi:PrsW family intramembrane metalloprotease [Lacibacter sediminis]|jgi:protease PrsW|uniref:Protease PrsW n=1 Tax=Lacibacter sediminis TaxID=2760713 RepID=A0A7G5XM27_9BACT|nr:PrsW family glutamic-type intramembrane protease [Lacibacter sediminis]QNA46530.1 PrsW family intramembrane metalloprotease [Lacibacter sediminis]
MLLLALSIAPGIAISLYIFLKDRFNREPHLNLLVCFLLGCLSIIPAIIIQLLTVKPVERLMGEGILYTAVFAYLIVGLSEEWSKYIMLRSYAYPRKSFDEPFDGIVYSVMIGMGFATVENILYVQQHGLGTAILRMFLSVPAHATFAVLMGYFAGKAKFKPERRKFYLFTGIFWAAFFHGTYDFFLFLQGNPTVNKYLSDSLLFVGAVASFIFAVWLSKKAIKEHHNLSKNMFHPDI